MSVFGSRRVAAGLCVAETTAATWLDTGATLRHPVLQVNTLKENAPSDERWNYCFGWKDGGDGRRHIRWTDKRLKQSWEVTDDPTEPARCQRKGKTCLQTCQVTLHKMFLHDYRVVKNPHKSFLLYSSSIYIFIIVWFYQRFHRFILLIFF